MENDTEHEQPKLVGSLEPKPLVNPDSGLENKSLDELLTERGSRYGSIEEQFGKAQMIKHAINSHPNWRKMDLVKREALEMIATKISRIIVGDPNHIDNWQDIAGYSQCVIKTIRGEDDV